MKENKKPDIKRDNKKLLIIACIISIMFVAGIPMIIFGATNSIMAVMALGIAFVVIGFYGTPLVWIAYGSNRTLKRVVDAVLEENLTTNEEIASQLQMREREVKTHLTKAINKKYITGFLYDGKTLSANEKIPVKKTKIMQNRCVNCGGTLIERANGYECEYCGSKFDKNI